MKVTVTGGLERGFKESVEACDHEKNSCCPTCSQEDHNIVVTRCLVDPSAGKFCVSCVWINHRLGERRIYNLEVFVALTARLYQSVLCLKGSMSLRCATIRRKKLAEVPACLFVDFTSELICIDNYFCIYYVLSFCIYFKFFYHRYLVQ